MRNFFHYLVSILLWILFGYYWYVVSGRQISWDTFQALIVLGLISLLGLLVTAGWVRHNQNIARRNTRTSRPSSAEELLTHDHLGRPIIAPLIAEMKQAHVVSINLDQKGNKVYAAPKGMQIL